MVVRTSPVSRRVPHKDRHEVHQVVVPPAVAEEGEVTSVMENDEAADGRAAKEEDGPPRPINVQDHQGERPVQQRPSEADPSLGMVGRVPLKHGLQELDVVRFQRPRRLQTVVRLHLGVRAVLVREISRGEEGSEYLCHSRSFAKERGGSKLAVVRRSRPVVRMRR